MRSLVIEEENRRLGPISAVFFGALGQGWRVVLRDHRFGFPLDAKAKRLG